MTGRIESIAGNRVTISGQTFEFHDAIRWVLELSERDGCEVEAVVVGGIVRSVTRYYPKVAT